jgi:hypothetical protein
MNAKGPTRSKRRAKLAPAKSKPFWPLDSAAVQSLARQELREALEGFRAAQRRCAEAERALRGLRGAEGRAVEALAERAAWTGEAAGQTITHTLLLLWGAARSLDEALGYVRTRPWEPCGAIVEGFFGWIEPAIDNGKLYYAPVEAVVHVVALDELSDRAEAALLANLPCRTVRLGFDGATILCE